MKTQSALLKTRQQEDIKAKDNKWLLKTTTQFIFVAICLSIAYISFILLDALVQYIIIHTFGDIITKYTFVENWVDGFKILSAAIIGLVYLFHLLYAVIDQVRFTLRVFQRMREREQEA